MRCFIALTVTLLLLSACGPAGSGAGSAAPSKASGRPVIVTSTTVLADLIRQVAGDSAEVISLVPAGANPYEFEPSPRDAATLAKATVFFANGLQYEAFSRKLLEEASPKPRVVTLSDGQKVRQSTIDHDDHGHLFQNPYVYLDVRGASAYVERVRDTLVAIDPPNEAAYRSRAAAYLTELGDLDDWIAAEVARLPQPRRILLKDHDSFLYYAARYGFVSLAASYEGTKEATPSAAHYAALLRQVRQFKAPVAFGEEGFSSKLLQQLASDTGIRFVPGLYAVTLGTTAETDSYLKMMRWNTRLIVEHLQETRA